MARRKRTSPFEDLIDLVAMLPWWAGVALALIFYAWLHYVATQPTPSSLTDIKQLGEFASGQIWVSIALFAQYLLPAACLLGAGLSAYGRHRRNSLHDHVASAPSRNALERITWREFEQLVGEVFRRKGFSVEERGGDGPDGGVDLVLRAGKDTYFVQCKKWKADRIGVATVRELYGVMMAEGAVGGFVVASGDFTEDAERFAEGRSIELIGTHWILAMIEETSDVSVSTLAPGCPVCGTQMVKRKAKRGDRAGEMFWGCSSYPDCRGVRAI